jgi:hypothetical protein
LGTEIDAFFSKDFHVLRHADLLLDGEAVPPRFELIGVNDLAFHTWNITPKECWVKT